MGKHNATGRSRGKHKADHRADTRGGGFAGIPLCVINSDAYRHLTPRPVGAGLTPNMRARIGVLCSPTFYVGSGAPYKTLAGKPLHRSLGRL